MLKRRTRQHVIGDLGVSHVERIILEAGHVAQRVVRDYGYDLLLFTFDEGGDCEPDMLPLQVKASESLHAVGKNFVFDVDVRDYNLWKSESMPVILMLFDASRKRAYWSAIQARFGGKPARVPPTHAKTVRLYVPCSQVLNQRALAKLRALKAEARR